MTDGARTAIHPRLSGVAPPLACTREVGGTPERPTHCGRPATTHIIWNMQAENGLACDEHAVEARRWAYAGMHPYEMVCSIGGARWLPDEDRCVVDDDDLGLEATAEMALSNGS